MSTYRDLRYPYPSGGPRASTSAVYDTAYDTRFGTSSRPALDYPSNRGRPYQSSVASRSSLDPSHTTLAPYVPYAPRARRNSSTEPSSRAPLGHPPVESYNRPVIRTHDLQRIPPPKIYTPKEDSAGVVYPAVSRRNHLRHNSSTTEDFSRLSLAEKDRLDRHRSVHRNSYVGASRGYSAAQMARYPTEDGYSYTGPREQFDRDYPVRQPRPRPDDFQRQERPISMIDYGDPKGANYTRREPPPSSIKRFEQINRAEGRRPGSHSGVASDTERDFERGGRRESSRQPVSIHQYERDDGYSSQRDDHHERRQARHERPPYEDDRYLSDRDRHHRHSHYDKGSKPRHERAENKEHSKDHSNVKAGLAAGLGTIAGLALRESRDDRKDKEGDHDKEVRRTEKKERRRDRETQGELEEHERRDKPREKVNDLRLDSDPKRGPEQTREKSDSDSAHERHRCRHRHRDRAGHEGGSESGSDHRAAGGAAGDDVAMDEAKEHRRRHRHKHRHRDKDQELDDHEAKGEGSLVESPVDIRSEEVKPRKSVTVVEPQKEEVQEVKRKGILKTPRPAFPEDPKPAREGVLPLKDTEKKGVPVGARWTKINRILVNPAALEAAQERFEERDDYVIVLRVLTREEIQKLADKTREIREARERAEQERTPEEPEPQKHRKSGQRDDDRSNTDSDLSSSESCSEDEEYGAQAQRSGGRRESENRERPLPIEPTPEQHPSLLNQFMQAASQPEPSPVPVMAAPAQHSYQQATPQQSA